MWWVLPWPFWSSHLSLEVTLTPVLSSRPRPVFLVSERCHLIWFISPWTLFFHFHSLCQKIWEPKAGPQVCTHLKKIKSKLCYLLDIKLLRLLTHSTWLLANAKESWQGKNNSWGQEPSLAFSNTLLGPGRSRARLKQSPHTTELLKGNSVQSPGKITGNSFYT